MSYIYNINLFMLLKGSINPLAIQLYPEGWPVWKPVSWRVW